MLPWAALLLQSYPFETIPRANNVDWIGMSFLLTSLVTLMFLQYRNPSAIGSMVARSFQETSKKLYFAAPAIDSIDKLLFSIIYYFSGALCIHILFHEFLEGGAKIMAYSFPIILVFFLFGPMRIAGFISGTDKAISKIVKRQMPIIYLKGLMLLMIGILLFLRIETVLIWNWIILILLASFLIWLHIRIAKDLILEQISILYIFMYFCTLEILPIFIFVVWISRN
jgi:hypothetical protein